MGRGGRVAFPPVDPERNVVDQPVLPDYAGACISNIVPALLDGTVEPPAWLPDLALDASQVVLLVLDGLGWEQLGERRALAPTLSSLLGGPITSVSPSTTATALTSIATGLTPGRHGVVGYRVAVDHEVLNILRWSTPEGDARARIVPEKFQPTEAFCGQRAAMVTKAEFATSGFSAAHLGGARFRGYRVPSTMVVELGAALRAGEPFVYAYYDGIDKVSHEYGLADHYDAELVAVDRLVGDILEVLPRGAALVVTADHGQVDVGERVLPPHADVAALASFQSGEGRFRWLHARPGRGDALLEAARAHHDDVAWVVSREQTIDEGWWGPEVTDAARQRLGDVALVCREPVSFSDPADSGPFELIGRHGSLTAAEMYVPLLVGAPR
ncbi:MAG: alkaline phosphatase family protein [Acidimicrobiales bacterium]|nr:alkaline phosphatase family protein [Acidimicrobiales bacterium]